MNDFEVNERDILILKEWDPKKKEYTGRKVEKKAEFVFKFKSDELPFYDKKEVEKRGLQIISLK